MSQFKVTKIEPFSAEVEVPGDKSISHRSVMLAALTNGACEIDGFLPSEDCLATVAAVEAMGVKIERLEEGEYGPTKLRVHGTKGVFTKPEKPIDCGNSGTAMRLLSGILAAQDFESELTGDKSLNSRTMERIVKPLTAMGASITASGEKQTAPLKIKGNPDLKGIEYELPVASAQVKSSIILAGQFVKGVTTVIEPEKTRDHTERMLKYFLGTVQRDGNRISTWGGQRLESRDLRVPGDISSAAFWIVAAAAKPGAHLLVRNVGLNPTRSGILKALVRMGARINEVVDEANGEPIGYIEVHGQKLHGTEIAGDEIPNVIDEIPILAIAAALAEGVTTIRDAEDLRHKESNRIAAVTAGLKSMGVPVQDFIDGMEITGVPEMEGGQIESLGDHRIAMAFAIAGLFASGETVINDVDCVKTSYPGFEKELCDLRGI